MKGGFEYPSVQGVPTQLTYAAMQKEQARQALVRMHEHLSRQFPEACPMTMDPAPPARTAPGARPGGHRQGGRPGAGGAAPAPAAAALKATPEDDGLFMDAEVYKGFKKAREEARQEGPRRQDDRRRGPRQARPPVRPEEH